MNLALTLQRGGRLDGESEAFVNALDRRGGGADDNEAQAVRRLTPVECERLQGWPDGWTLPEGPSLTDAPTWLDDGFVADEHCPPPDSPRLAAAGDGVTAPVAEWIGRRLLALDPGGP